MSNYLEKLLDGDDVAWVPLGEVAVLKRGTSITKKDVITGEIPVIAGGRTPAYYHNVSNRDGETIVIAGSGAYAGFISWRNKPIFVSDAFTVKTRAHISPKYCYHFLMAMQTQLHDLKSGGGIPHVYPKDVARIPIPIPCPHNPAKSLAIQSKIAGILDTFTALTTELSARKKQYNYYRDKLLTFDEGQAEWKTLGDVLHMRAGQHISARKIMENASEEYPYPCFGGNGIRGFVTEKSHEGAYLLIGRQGALCGNVQRMKGKFYATEHAVVVTCGKEVNVDWAFHLLTTMNLNQYASKSAQPGLAVGNLENLKIPLPSINKQIYAASILDKFDTLTTSLSAGLPREIELRQQQYAYYRAMLLNFPKPAAVLA
jgi:type I restriction enzyme, S subunit